MPLTKSMESSFHSPQSHQKWYHIKTMITDQIYSEITNDGVLNKELIHTECKIIFLNLLIDLFCKDFSTLVRISYYRHTSGFWQHTVHCCNFPPALPVHHFIRWIIMQWYSWVMKPLICHFITFLSDLSHSFLGMLSVDISRAFCYVRKCI